MHRLSKIRLIRWYQSAIKTNFLQQNYRDVWLFLLESQQPCLKLVSSTYLGQVWVGLCVEYFPERSYDYIQVYKMLLFKKKFQNKPPPCSRNNLSQENMNYLSVMIFLYICFRGNVISRLQTKSFQPERNFTTKKLRRLVGLQYAYQLQISSTNFVTNTDLTSPDIQTDVDQRECPLWKPPQ